MLGPVLSDICRDENFIELVKNAEIMDVIKFEDEIRHSELNEAAQINSQYMENEIVNGMYRRTLMMPANKIITGALHVADYMDIMISGHIMVKSFMVDGSIESSEELEGFNIMRGVAGRKRVAYTLEDTIWQTVERTTASSVREAEEECLVYDIRDWPGEDTNV